MREVIFKNFTSVQSRKKDIVLREAFEKDGVVAKTERRCFYYIKDVKRLADETDLQKWVDAQAEIKLAQRQFHIMKEHNDRLGEDKVICKIAGSFYAVINNVIYNIAFIHSFKVCFMKAAVAH